MTHTALIIMVAELMLYILYRVTWKDPPMTIAKPPFLILERGRQTMASDGRTTWLGWTKNGHAYLVHFHVGDGWQAGEALARMKGRVEEEVFCKGK